MEGNLKSDFTQEESQRETEFIGGKSMSYSQSPTDVSISSAASTSLSSSVGRKRKGIAAEEVVEHSGSGQHIIIFCSN